MQFIFLFDVLTAAKYASPSPLYIYGFYMFKLIKKQFQLLSNLVP